LVLEKLPSAEGNFYLLKELLSNLKGRAVLAASNIRSKIGGCEQDIEK